MSILVRYALAGIALLLIAPVQAEPDGKALFDQHCSTCHNYHGEGGIGLPLNTATLSTVDDDYLARTIANGRVGRIMPAFDRLDQQQNAAVVAYLREMTGPSKVELPATVPGGDAERGGKLFADNCARCHGEDGRGAGLGTGVTMSRSRDFVVNPPAITNPGFLASASDPLLVHTILNGRPGTIMPSFAALGFDQQQAADVVAWLRKTGDGPLRNPITVVPGSLSHVVESDYDLETTVENVKRTLQGYNFRGFPERKLQQGLTTIDKVDQRQVALRFCNFDRLYDLLRVEPRLGVVLPCRITVVESVDGVVNLYAPNLRTVASWFNNAELQRSFDQLDDVLLDILEESTL